MTTWIVDNVLPWLTIVGVIVPVGAVLHTWHSGKQERKEKRQLELAPLRMETLDVLRAAMSLGAPYGTKSEALEALRGDWWRNVLERQFLLRKCGLAWLSEVDDAVSRLYILDRYEMREADDEHADELGAEFTQLQILMHNRYNQLCSNDKILLS